MAACLTPGHSPRVTVHVGDGFEYMHQHKNAFDVIITDSSDPSGPAESLFGEDYYKLVSTALTDEGVAASQGESPFLHGQLVRSLMAIGRKVFPRVGYAMGLVPTYPCGHMGYLVCSKNEVTSVHFIKVVLSLQAIDVRTPVRMISESDADRMQLRYYNGEVHKAAFILPHAMQKVS